MTSSDRNALAQELLRSRARPKLIDNSAALQAVTEVYIETNRDHDLDMELEVIIAQMMNPEIKEGYAVMVTGPSGAGKTKLVTTRLDATPELQPFEHYGNMVQWCLRVTTPSACTVRGLGTAILEASGYKMERAPSEPDVWLTVRNRLPLAMHKIIFFDEFQHVLKGPKAKGVAHLTNTIKILMQNPEWPVWLIFAGVPSIREFIDRDEWFHMDRRVVEISIDDLKDPFLEPLEEDGSTVESEAVRTYLDLDNDGEEQDEETTDVENMRDIIQAMAGAGGLTVSFPLTDEFMRRLMHGGLWRFGMTLQIIRMSIEAALWDKANESRSLRFKHFVAGYGRLSRCDTRSNVLNAPDWQRITRQVTKKNRLTSGYILRPE